MTKEAAAIEHRENMAFISEYWRLMSPGELDGWSDEQAILWVIITYPS